MYRPFTIIPVIDLMGGQVVKAVGGDRTQYQPIRSPLSSDASPVGVAKGLLSLAPLNRLYFADLDALAGHPPQIATITAITQAFPDVELWVDGGIGTEADCQAWAAKTASRIVLGSETLHDLTLPVRRGSILSLDFQGETFLGNPGLLTEASLWPPEVIVMTLDRVGSSGGPALELLTAIMARAGERRIYAAGGVRNKDDLDALATIGVTGALIATALHSGTITLKSFFGEHAPKGQIQEATGRKRSAGPESVKKNRD